MELNPLMAPTTTLLLMLAPMLCLPTTLHQGTDACNSAIAFHLIIFNIFVSYGTEAPYYPTTYSTYYTAPSSAPTYYPEAKYNAGSR